MTQERLLKDCCLARNKAAAWKSIIESLARRLKKMGQESVPPWTEEFERIVITFLPLYIARKDI
jgi:hypothetical protein